MACQDTTSARQKDKPSGLGPSRDGSKSFEYNHIVLDAYSQASDAGEHAVQWNRIGTVARPVLFELNLGKGAVQREVRKRYAQVRGNAAAAAQELSLLLR